MCQFLPLLKDGGLEQVKLKEISAAEITTFVRAFPRTSVVTLTGGEPFIRSDLDEIIHSLVPRNKVHIITNGTLLDEAAISFVFRHRLRSLWSGGILAVGISLHGIGEIHDAIVNRRGAYAEACRAIRLLRKMREAHGTPFPHVHLTCVITDRNADHLVDMYREACDIVIDYCNFTIMNAADYRSRLPGVQFAPYETIPPLDIRIEPTILREQFNLLEGLCKDGKTKIRLSPFDISPEEIVRYYSGRTDICNYRCTSPWRMLGISAYGEMSSCLFNSLGNIRNIPASDAWKGRLQQRFRRHLKREGIFPICLGCCVSKYVGKR
jgi:MoaA/NifB/PqqE/SkfB family radical SAM enzyme